MASKKEITHADIIEAAAHQLDAYASDLDMVQAVRAGVPDLTAYYRSQLQVTRDNLRGLAELMRDDAKGAGA